MSSAMSHDLARRGSCRREIALPCQAVRERDFKLIADRTLDLSLDGLLLPLRARVLTGESLIVSFPIPGMWIDVEATVARIVHGRRPGDDGLAAGILFHALAPSARAALAGFLHGKREPLPRRRPVACVRRGAGLPQLAEAGVDGLGVLRAVVGAWVDLSSAVFRGRPPEGHEDLSSAVLRGRRPEGHEDLSSAVLRGRPPEGHEDLSSAVFRGRRPEGHEDLNDELPDEAGWDV
jgi:hypothetical protein